MVPRMGYHHIENLYQNQLILHFRKCYALEKIHGTSAHVAWDQDRVRLSPGGESAERFTRLFDVGGLESRFRAIGYPRVTVYGEAYGGRQQAQAWRYGADLRFVAFDVRVDDTWLCVPEAAALVAKLDLEFVFHEIVSTDLEALDAARDAPSVQAQRNGVAGPQPREGVVLRPLVEFLAPDGTRLIAKHKRDEERETATPRRVVDPAEQRVLDDAEAIAREWVTPTRLEHVLDKLPGATIQDTQRVIAAMREDVLREAKHEIVDSKAARAAIGKATSKLFRVWLSSALRVD